ncbi:MAG TPA: alpha/beta fold hydrolase, partial [Candidatus Baltobacteraceae bacterium]|nr:alpha/beta fold hydrolase [Candidatus Baltobacteraceae bacterium]
MGTYRASDGAELYFDEAGENASLPLLFVHGWQANGTIWQPAIDALGSRYRTIAVDLRGTGRSRR